MKLDRTEKQIVRCAHFLNHTIYVCDVHRLFSNKMAITNVRTARKNAKNLRRKMNENN